MRKKLNWKKMQRQFDSAGLKLERSLDGLVKCYQAQIARRDKRIVYLEGHLKSARAGLQFEQGRNKKAA